ncbi:hypothetical protein FA10DRAFT_288637 [Acaromyces ingoldii]|uniref:Uncharacterized protein n=1 Tax=Acaromyces ingoldii TaxID=215250 RepID=A0A316YFP1_9BASI|nr:hypothetical protein FA10DRAFT_288637 [Acaromyces ingoldii]PWN87941.1 hypothetical protein FA10DRAFT_288637 [Acaromyces ingoldii]
MLSDKAQLRSGSKALLEMVQGGHITVDLILTLPIDWVSFALEWKQTSLERLEQEQEQRRALLLSSPSPALSPAISSSSSTPSLDSSSCSSPTSSAVTTPTECPSTPMQVDFASPPQTKLKLEPPQSPPPLAY